jgi:DNA-binding response OmpR family regulator
MTQDPIDQNKSIWIVEDDQDLLRLYKEMFDYRYKTKYLSSLKEFKKEYGELLSGEAEIPSLVIADLNFCDGNFVNHLSNKISGAKDILDISLQYFIVSALDDIDVIRHCLDRGVIDYLVKPIRRNELLVKIENALSNLAKPSNFIDGPHKTLTLDGIKIPNLTSKQMQVLSLFLQSPGRVVFRREILKKVWGETTVHPKTVDVHLYNLRRKLGSHGFFIRSEGGGKWALMAEKFQ